MAHCATCDTSWTGHRIDCPLDRFWSKLIPAPSGCWRWVGAFNTNGYGRIYGDGDPGEPRVMYAHRFAHKHLVGPIPEGMVVDHLCRHKACVNPLHMQVVTNRVNVTRGFSRMAKVSLTTCPWGHPYTPDNTFLSSSGGRACRACRRVGSKKERVR